MKVDISRIRSVGVVEKPDGRYCRIELVKREPAAAKAMTGLSQVTRKMWANPWAKAAIIAIAAVTLFNIFLRILGI